VGVVERWLPRVNLRKDLFGCIDLLAMRRGEPGIVGVQATSASNLAAGVKKARQQPELGTWLACGNRFDCWGWARRGRRWHVGRVAIRGEDLAPVLLTAAPRRRGKQRQLFEADAAPGSCE
jgi:hypothetical protein